MDRRATMARLMTQFALGAVLTTVLVYVLFPEWEYKTTVIVAGGLWALVPDFYLFSPIPEELVGQIGSSRFGDLFWFHRTLNEQFAGVEFRRTAGVAIGALLLVVGLTEWHENRTDDSK